MPSYVIHDQVPHSIIFPNQPFFCLPLVSLVVSILSIFLLLDKNLHLVEATYTLLLHHKVPQLFLWNSILVVCYLVNHMPSSVLHDQILHAILFPNKPLLCLPPRVFGCICFVHILTHRQDKLLAKATKCLLRLFSTSERL